MIVMPNGGFCLPLKRSFVVTVDAARAYGSRSPRAVHSAKEGVGCQGTSASRNCDAAIAAGEIDTVIVAFADAQGRLVGKRVSARLFQEEVLPHGAEACNYLLSVDVDMNTVDGYAMSSWETGYGDMMLLPDADDPAADPVAAGHRARDGRPRRGRAATRSCSRRATILKRQRARLAERGLIAYSGTELEFIVFDDTYRDAWAKGYRDLTPSTDYNVDYDLLASGRLEPLLRDIRRGMDGAGMYCEGVKGECNFGQQEIAFRYAEVLETADQHTIYKNGAKEIAEQARQVADLHGEVQRARGQQLPHPPLGAWPGRRRP